MFTKPNLHQYTTFLVTAVAVNSSLFLLNIFSLGIRIRAGFPPSRVISQLLLAINSIGFVIADIWMYYTSSGSTIAETTATSISTIAIIYAMTNLYIEICPWNKWNGIIFAGVDYTSVFILCVVADIYHEKLQESMLYLGLYQGFFMVHIGVNFLGVYYVGVGIYENVKGTNKLIRPSTQRLILIVNIMINGTIAVWLMCEAVLVILGLIWFTPGNLMTPPPPNRNSPQISRSEPNKA
eukprot:TRINITY_DN19032_c0_g1_i1.p2 TRINITY_DN19032_c0_g1~~TRINITY_DN19032_c0_g1_i1.p2  ORF type:complete len:238 (-),score=40.19 TRINITY_DN19032_c0_g1_i1:665-1378(-)